MKYLDTNSLLFEIITKDKHIYKIYLDGTVSGFPDDIVINNHAIVLFSELSSRSIRKVNLKTVSSSNHESNSIA